MAEEEKKEEKKIIADEDWKQQAQKEKEILAAQEEAEKHLKVDVIALCGDCLCEVMANSGHTIQSPDTERSHCVWLPDVSVIQEKLGRKPTPDEVVNVRHAFEKGIEGQVDWEMAFDFAITEA